MTRGKPPTNYTAEQIAILDEFKYGARNLVVRARAGTGKTFTILAGVELAPEHKILLCAFNKRIAEELKRKVNSDAVEAKTLHSLGFAFVRRNWQGVKLNADRGLKLARQVCDLYHRAEMVEWEAGDCEGPQPSPAPHGVTRLIKKLASIAKGCLPFATCGDDLEELAVAHDCMPDEEHEEDGYTMVWLCNAAHEAMMMATQRDQENEIDFDDMLFVPVRNGWARPWYDLVCIDECQDLSVSQLHLAQKACKKGGRIVVVGDDRQAIYKFRGADSGSIDRLKAELDAVEMPLTATFRCGRAIVAKAQKYVPDIRPHDSVGPGKVRSMMRSGLLDAAQVGDFVLSRKNAPLASVCLSLLRDGKRARIEGKDIGASLCSLVRRLAKGRGRTMQGLSQKLDIWEQRECQRAKSLRHESARENLTDLIRDKAAMIREMSPGLSSTTELIARINDLFEDDGRPSIVCSTVHKAKGLEADRVFILEDSFSLRRGGDSSEEANIRYVSITRAKLELVQVYGDEIEDE